jgi:hypothetical protein
MSRRACRGAVGRDIAVMAAARGTGATHNSGELEDRTGRAQGVKHAFSVQSICCISKTQRVQKMNGAIQKQDPLPDSPDQT